MRTSDKRGSSIVEAAMVLPLVFLVAAQIISGAMTLTGNVRDLSGELIGETAETVSGLMISDEDLLRGRWILK